MKAMIRRAKQSTNIYSLCDFSRADKISLHVDGLWKMAMCSSLYKLEIAMALSFASSMEFSIPLQNMIVLLGIKYFPICPTFENDEVIFLMVSIIFSGILQSAETLVL